MSGSESSSNITENGTRRGIRTRAICGSRPRLGRPSHLRPAACAIPTGLAWSRRAKTLAVVNERDEIGPDLVPTICTSCMDGALRLALQLFRPASRPAGAAAAPDLVAKAIVPDYALSSHVAPWVWRCTPAAAFPRPIAAERSSANMASWDRTPLNGYKVVFVPFSSGKPSGPAQDVVTGFTSDANDHARGRPVGLAIRTMMATSDRHDVGDTVWRSPPVLPVPRSSQMRDRATGPRGIENRRLESRRRPWLCPLLIRLRQKAGLRRTQREGQSRENSAYHAGVATARHFFSVSPTRSPPQAGADRRRPRRVGRRF